MLDQRKLLRLASLGLPVVLPSLTYGGLAYHVASTSPTAKATASSPNPTTNHQQCVADPRITDVHVAGTDVLPPNDGTTYVVAFQGTMSWVGDVTFSHFSPDPAGVYSPGSAIAGVSSTPVVHVTQGGGSVDFEGYYSPYYFGEGFSTPPTPANQDQDFITGNFDSITTSGVQLTAIPIVNYTVSYTSLTLYDTSTGTEYFYTNPNSSLPADDPSRWTDAETVTGAPDLNMPEPTAASVLCLGGVFMAARRRRCR